MDVPEIIPIPLQPEVQKNLTPSAVKRSEPPIFDPEQDGNHEEHKKKRKSGHSGGQRNSRDEAEQPQPSESGRGSRINIRA